MSLPAELGIFSRELENYTSNRFKLEIQGNSSSAKAGNIISVLLPENSIIDLHSLRMCFRMDSTAFAAGSTGNAGMGIMGDDIRSIISSLNVFINGISVQQNMPEYNSLVKVLGLVDNNTNRKDTIDNVLSNGNMYSGDTKATPENRDFVIDKWRGFLQESNCRFLDTSLFGSVQIRVTLAAPAAVMSPYSLVGGGTKLGFTDVSGISTSEGGVANYELHDIYWTVDCISLGRDYGRMLREVMERDGVLPVNYREYYNYPLGNQSSTQFTNRFQLSSQSIDCLYGVTRRGDYADGYGLKPTDAQITAGTPLWAGAYLHDKAYTTGAYTNAYYKFCSFTDEAEASEGLNTDMTWNYRVNNVQYPQTPGTLLQAAADIAFIADKNDVKRDLGIIASTFPDFKLSKCIIPLRLSFNDNIALLSGYNSRGVNSTIDLTVKNMNAAAIAAARGSYENTIFAKTTATLKVAPGKSLAVSY